MMDALGEFGAQSIRCCIAGPRDHLGTLLSPPIISARSLELDRNQFGALTLGYMYEYKNETRLYHTIY